VCDTGAPPSSWGGDNGTGSVSALPATAAGGGLVVTASTGALTVNRTAPVVFRFDLLVTPVKKLETARHFSRDR
jgi:hypothetical protein